MDTDDIVVMVTGHRNVTHPALVSERLTHVLDKLAPARAISGGAQGADTMFAETALNTGVPLSLYLPNRWYTNQYPASVSGHTITRADEVRFVVDRPNVTDWATQWKNQRWWVDNFARNKAMVADSTHTVVVSPTHPRELIGAPKGGTAACLRDVVAHRGRTQVIWIPDSPNFETRWVTLTPETSDSPPSLFDT